MQGIPYFVKEEAVIEEELVFSFVSKGSKGDIEKIIRYERMSSNIFNLGFGDRISDTLYFDDEVVTNNGDMVKVLNTVINTFSVFFTIYPNYGILMRGSDERRTEIYRWMIERNLDKLLKNYYVHGMKDDKSSEEFKKGRLYKYFVIFKKNK